MLKLFDLKTNHRTAPLGIDGVPYFGWKYRSDRKNVTQQAYRLTVEDVQTKEVVWDSGAVSSSQSSFADYAGAPLLMLMRNSLASAPTISTASAFLPRSHIHEMESSVL